MKTIILDTEMNGMYRQEICQLSYIIKTDDQRVGRNFFFAVSSMNPYAQAKHGFSKKRLYDLSGGRSFADRLDEFYQDFVGTDLLCGHGLNSDLHALKLGFSDAGCAFPHVHVFCTMTHFQNATRLTNKAGKPKPPKLEELCQYLGIGEDRIKAFTKEVFGKSAYRAHDARFDTAATYLCIQEGQERGDLRGVI